MIEVKTAVILAAGEGTRMRPLTYTRPKVMLPLADKPILEHLLVEIIKAGIKKFIFIVGYRNEVIRGYFADGQKWGVEIQYCPQVSQLGTADAVRMVDGEVTGNFLLANGDVIINQSDIKKLIALKNNALSAVQLPDVTGLGALEVRGDRIVRLHEKKPDPPSHLANAGLYLFTPEIFNAISHTAKSPRGEFELTDSIQWLIDQGHPVFYDQIQTWFDLSYPWDLLAANENLMSGLESQNLGEIEPNVNIKGPISVGRGSLVRSGAYIIGPVIIGEDCEIGPNCYLRPTTTIGHHCHVGAGVEIKNSILMSDSKVPHLSYVGDSIIGENCNLGAGTKIANLRLDKKPISIKGLSTGRRKLGAILGDNVQTGINSSINLGTLIGNNSFIAPGALAHGIIPPDSTIR